MRSAEKISEEVFDEAMKQYEIIQAIIEKMK
jgi:hypothetical protein